MAKCNQLTPLPFKGLSVQASKPYAATQVHIFLDQLQKPLQMQFSIFYQI